MPGHDWRSARAEEFVDVALRLCDSWHDEAPQADRQGVYVNPESTQAIHHKGEHFRVDGPLTIPRPPQGHPVLFQAGPSEQGRDLAARRAEAIYAVAYDLAAALESYRDNQRRVPPAVRSGPVPIMPGMITSMGSHQAEWKGGEL